MVLLIAAIALANRGWTTTTDGPETAADPLAPEIAHSRQGAQSTATKAAAVLGGEAMFNTEQRHALVQAVADPDKRGALQQAFDADYTAAFNRKIGLDDQGQPPAGAAFISRTLPAGTVVRAYRPQEATVDVWCSGLFGLTGKSVQEIPIKTSWFTMTVTVRWTHDGWRVSDFSQKDGPEPTSAAAAFGQAPQP
ncbi:hypothetical protein [Streptomyces sp. NPDC004592]